MFYAKLWKNTRRLVNIWLFLLLGLVAKAASFTVTVEAWNKASLSGDVTDAMAVSFVSTSKSAGKITADNTAKMTISGLPTCTVNAITLYVRSNQKSGAGVVVLSLANQSWVVASGTFDQWPGMSGYSSTARAMKGLTYAISVKKNTQLTLYIEGTANSVYIDQLVVDYTLTPPSPHTLTLQWPSQTGTMLSRQLTEPSASAGILLPSIDPQDSIILHDDDTWHWIGWCPSHFSAQSALTDYWEKDDWFYLEEDCTLHALYTNQTTFSLYPDSSFTNGEYALVYIAEDAASQFALSGPWNEGKIALQTPENIQKDQNDWVWQVSQIDSTMRYQLIFMSDSVSVYHPSSQTWIGHTTSSGSAAYCQWAWRKVANGSVILYGDFQPLASDQWSIWCLSLAYEEYTATLVSVYQQVTFTSTHSCWYLFPTAHVPSPAAIQYTTFAQPSSLPVLPIPSPSRKWLDPHGRIIIEYNNHSYNLLGQPL